MTRIIPRELIKHLEWSPGQQIPPQPQPVTAPPQSGIVYNIEDILNRGQPFYSNKKDGSMYVGVADSLQQAMDHATDEGIVVTMPELIAAKLQADDSHQYWQKWYSVFTEENIGIDKEGKFVTRGNPVYIAVHGGGILTPDRINQAYSEGLISNSAKYTEEEFDNLLKGELPNGDSIQLYTIDELKNGISGLGRRYGVVLPYEQAQSTKSDYHAKGEFVGNPLVVIRAGGMENIENYFERAKKSKGKVGSWHPFSGRDATQPQGRVLFLLINYLGLIGYINLDNSGRFVGVAPEAPGPR